MRKQIFFTSDWHIGHVNSIQFDRRPFRDLDHMHESLIKNYNAQVPKDGLCYFLGDMGVSNATEARGVISQLNGTKILVSGNHDKRQDSMYNCGFDVVLNGAVIYIKGSRVTLSHCPLMGVFRESLDHIPESRRVEGENWHGEKRYESGMFSFPDEGQFHLHGHIHSRVDTGSTKKKILGKQYDVGVPANGYRPVHIGVIDSWISKYKFLNKEEPNLPLPHPSTDSLSPLS
jgi:calcineurin-like phosphoesterase family protein